MSSLPWPVLLAELAGAIHTGLAAAGNSGMRRTLAEITRFDRLTASLFDPPSVAVSLCCRCVSVQAHARGPLSVVLLCTVRQIQCTRTDAREVERCRSDGTDGSSASTAAAAASDPSTKILKNHQAKMNFVRDSWRKDTSAMHWTP